MSYTKSIQFPPRMYRTYGGRQFSVWAFFSGVWLLQDSMRMPPLMWPRLSRPTKSQRGGQYHWPTDAYGALIVSLVVRSFLCREEPPRRVHRWLGPYLGALQLTFTACGPHLPTNGVTKWGKSYALGGQGRQSHLCFHFSLAGGPKSSIHIGLHALILLPKRHTLGIWVHTLLVMLSHAVMSVLQVFPSLWYWVWLVLLLRVLAFHPSWYEVTVVRIDAVVWAWDGMVEMVGFH
jgi:hypothetical protein